MTDFIFKWFLLMLFLEVVTFQWTCFLLSTGTTTWLSNKHFEVKERERFLLNPMENASSCKGMIPQRRKEASDTLQSPGIGFGPIHISTTVASLKAARACVCPAWGMKRGYQKKLGDMLSISKRTAHVGFDTHLKKKKTVLFFLLK